MVSDFVAGFWRLRDWAYSDQELLAFIEQLLELGVTSMDHAMVYRSEEVFGRALALKPSLREQMQIVSKCGIRPCGFGELGAEKTNYFDSSKAHIIRSVNASLKNLRTDHLDLMLLHRPDYLMNVSEVVEAFEELKQAGKVKSFGVSNFSSSQFALLNSAWPEGLVTNQVEFSPLNLRALEDGTFDQSQALSTPPMLWSCLAAGQLLSPTDERGEKVLLTLKSLQLELDADTVEQVVYAWCRALPCKPKVLLGSSKIERIRSAVKAESLTMTREQWYSLWESANGAPVP